jgi:hypothetical protein
MNYRVNGPGAARDTRGRLATPLTAAAGYDSTQCVGPHGIPDGILPRVDNPRLEFLHFVRRWDRPSSFVVCHTSLDTRRCGCQRSPGWGGGSLVLPTPRVRGLAQFQRHTAMPTMMRWLKARTIAMVKRGLGDRRQNPIVCPTLVRPERTNSSRGSITRAILRRFTIGAQVVNLPTILAPGRC